MAVKRVSKRIALFRGEFGAAKYPPYPKTGSKELVHSEEKTCLDCFPLQEATPRIARALFPLPILFLDPADNPAVLCFLGAGFGCPGTPLDHPGTGILPLRPKVSGDRPFLDIPISGVLPYLVSIGYIYC